MWITPSKKRFDGRCRPEPVHVGIPDAEIVRLERYGPGEPGAEGSVKQGLIKLGGREFRFFDR